MQRPSYPQSGDPLPADLVESPSTTPAANQKKSKFLSLEETAAILAEVNHDLRTWKRWQRWGVLESIGMLLLISLFLFVSSRNEPIYDRLGSPILLGILLLTGSMVVFMVRSGRPMCRAAFAGRRLRNLREKLEDTRLVGGLLEALGSDGIDVYTAAFLLETLTPVLRRLHTTQAPLLNERHRAILYDLMTAKRVYYYRPYAEHHADFTVAALRALQQVGDGGALPTVEHLAQTATNERIREAAGECLPFLVERAAQENAHRTLLRAAEVDPSPETLLRAIGETGAASADPQQLLRPGTPTDER